MDGSVSRKLSKDLYKWANFRERSTKLMVCIDAHSEFGRLFIDLIRTLMLAQSRLDKHIISNKNMNIKKITFTHIILFNYKLHKSIL